LALSVFCFRLNAEYTNTAICFDINNDDKSEIIAACSDDSLVIYDENLNLIKKIYTNGTVNSLPAIADIDYDGILDIVCWTASGFLQAFDLSAGNLKPGFENIYVANYSPKYLNPVIADFNKDNELEILIGNTRLYNFNGKGILNSYYPVDLISEIEKPPILFDNNKDGYNDLIVCCQDRRVKYVNLKNNGAFGELTSMSFKSDYNTFFVTDSFDGDTYPEIIYSYGKCFYIYTYSNKRDSRLFDYYSNQPPYTDNLIGGASIKYSDNFEFALTSHLKTGSNIKPYDLFAAVTFQTIANDTFNAIEFVDSYPRFIDRKITDRMNYYSASYIDYDNNGLLDLVYPGFKNYLNIIGYENEADSFMKKLAEISLEGKDVMASVIADVDGNRKADIVYNDENQIHIIPTNSSTAYSVYPLGDIRNTNTNFFITQPVICNDSAFITRGNNYTVKWKNPHFFDTYYYSYSLNGNPFSDFSKDSQITFNNLTDSDYVFLLKAKNERNRTTAENLKFVFKIDNAPPEISFISPQNNQTVSGLWNIKFNIKENNIDTILCFIKTDTTGYKKIYESHNTPETIQFQFDFSEYSGGTINLKICAYELLSNNFSESEITVINSKSEILLTPEYNGKICFDSSAVEISVPQNSVEYNQNFEIYCAQLSAYDNLSLFSPVYFIGGENISLKQPLNCAIKLSPTELNSSRFSKPKQERGISFENRPISVYYSSDSTGADITKIGGSIFDGYINFIFRNSGRYFAAASSDSYEYFAPIDTEKLNISVTPRIITQNQNASINFYFERQEKLNIKIYDLNGILIDKIYDGNFPSGNHSFPVYFSGAKYKSGLYIILFETGSKKIKKAVYIK